MLESASVTPTYVDLDALGEPQNINHTEAECLVYLSADERERAARFNQIAGRQRFTYIRHALRHLLGEALACRPDEIIF